MKARDLMIGDIVTFKDSLDSDVSPLRVEIVAIGYQDNGTEDECLVSIDGDDACDIIEIDNEVVGIPLTTEILEKNGFVRATNGYSWLLWDSETDDLLIMLKKISNAFVFVPLSGMEFGIQYVHELQHIFRLGGLKKEITL